MSHSQLIERVKKNPFVYKLYYYGFSAVVNFLKLFVKTDDKLILFVSYGGRHFNDSPKAIYEAMKTDERFRGYKLIWAFREPSKFPQVDKVRIDSLPFFVKALSARCWITNVNVERGLNFTGKKTYYFHTTHGTLPKLSGNDVKVSDIFGGSFRYRYDCSCAQSEIEKELQLSMFGLQRDQVLVCGYPKNDALAKASKENQVYYKQKLGIDPTKKVILYAPTFRENSTTEMISPVNFSKWETILGDKYVVLFRAHPIVVNKTRIDSESSFIIDVSSYPDNCELMIASDFLISDYSGIFFEYAILHRPMYCYGYDYDEYEKTRGLYMDLRKELPSGSEEEILNRIKQKNHDDDMLLVNTFCEKYVSEYGHATQKAMDNIWGEIS